MWGLFPLPKEFRTLLKCVLTGADRLVDWSNARRCSWLQAARRFQASGSALQVNHHQRGPAPALLQDGAQLTCVVPLFVSRVGDPLVLNSFVWMSSETLFEGKP